MRSEQEERVLKNDNERRSISLYRVPSPLDPLFWVTKKRGRQKKQRQMNSTVYELEISQAEESENENITRRMRIKCVIILTTFFGYFFRLDKINEHFIEDTLQLVSSFGQSCRRIRFFIPRTHSQFRATRYRVE